MGIEQKAKTFLELSAKYSLLLPQPVKPWKDMLSSQWVPLEEAQKLEAECTQKLRAYEMERNRIRADLMKELEQKIVVALTDTSGPQPQPVYKDPLPELQPNVSSKRIYSGKAMVAATVLAMVSGVAIIIILSYFL